MFCWSYYWNVINCWTFAVIVMPAFVVLYCWEYVNCVCVFFCLLMSGNIKNVLDGF